MSKTAKYGLFICDPSKNVDCKKTHCYKNVGGGECMCTPNEAFALDKEETPCQEKTADGELMYEEGETVIVPKDEYRQLVFNAHLVDCLEELGVDNWQGYGDAYKNAEQRMEAFDNDR